MAQSPDQTIHSGQLGAPALDQLFREARTFSYWLDKPVDDGLLRDLYDLMKWGPTSVNGSPARILFLRTPQSKQRLLPALAPMNVEKVRAAPVTAVVAYDLDFFEQLPKLWPHAAGIRDHFAGSPELADTTARRNSSLQGAYLIVAARALGLDCGPLSGFDNAKVDAEFFPSNHIRSNFLCNIGYGDRAKLHPRNPRLAFEEACTLL
ncbi:MAG: malonic semialdehyde reductase [Acidobacteria bacterium]|nr:malonic semialdehyde reductase [Acidobacteriota bacterium]